MRRAHLSNANLRYAKIRYADLEAAVINGADLRHTYLTGSRFQNTRIQNSNMSYADLTGATFERAVLHGLDLCSTIVNDTKFYGVDLGSVSMSQMWFEGPCAISLGTLFSTRGRILDSFLQGCGLSDWEIQAAKLYRDDLDSQTITDILYRIHDLKAYQSIQISPLFISYSHLDDRFVDSLETLLIERGVRFWRDKRHATSGRLEKQIDRAIRLNPTVLLILSCNSVKSDWVEHEARVARAIEKELGRDILCPIALDESWKNCDWPARLREQIYEYHILDFSNWENKDQLKSLFIKLLAGLNLFYRAN